MVMSVGVFVYAAPEYRIRQALQGHDTTCPHQSGTRVQHPTARWVCHDVVGINLSHRSKTVAHRLASHRCASPPPITSRDTSIWHGMASKIYENQTGHAECRMKSTWVTMDSISQ